MNDGRSISHAKSAAKSQAQSHARPPSVDQVLRTSVGADALAKFGHESTVKAVREAVQAARASPQSGAGAAFDAEAIAASALQRLTEDAAPTLRRVFNLTGTVLHTNLGRAVLPESAIAAAVEAMRSAVSLEFDIGGAVRGERDDHVRGLLRELTGAEDACVVNNNAAAVLLVLNTFGAGKEAIVSRGELIEIGGSFRLPDIMARAGAKLIEVGTTNRTHLKDYQQALGPETGLILKAHPSNYLIQGFTKSVEPGELAALARTATVPFVHDLGSGALLDLARYGLHSEPTVRQALAEGADVVTFSGDKLLGGPQAGIVAGRKELIAQIARNPMKRAMRLDKIRLAVLEAVLKLYRDPDSLAQHLPTLRYFTHTRADIAAVADRLAGPVAAAAGAGYAVTATDCSSQIGSGALPLETLPSAGLAMTPTARKGAGTQLERVATAFRSLPVPVIGRIKDGALILDLRCLDDEPGFLAQLPRLTALLKQGAAS